MVKNMKIKNSKNCIMLAIIMMVISGSNLVLATKLNSMEDNKYDVNSDGVVNFFDAYLVWINRDSVAPYNPLYDVNDNGNVNFQDAGLVWSNRDDTNENFPPIITCIKPSNNSSDVLRPPTNLSVDVFFNIENDKFNLSIFIYKPNGEKVILENFSNCTNGIYSCPVPSENEYIYGDTTYRWGANATDSFNFTTVEFEYKTCGSRYDVDNNGKVDIFDIFQIWKHRSRKVTYDGLFDVNSDDKVNFIDIIQVIINLS